MAVFIDFLGFKCFNQLRNGVSLDENPSDFTPNLVGNVGELVKVEYQLRPYWRANATTGDTWSSTLISGDDYFIVRSNGNFLQDGFAVGDKFFYYTTDVGGRLVTPADFAYIGEVKAISSDGKRLDIEIIVGPAAGREYTDSEFPQMGAFIGFFNPFSAIYLKFGLNENSEPFLPVSLLSQEETGYYRGGLTYPNAGLTMLPRGQFKSWYDNQSSAVVKVDTDSDGDIFTITHIFRITPQVLAGQDVRTDVIDQFLDSNSLKYAFEVDFRPSLSNPRSINAVYNSTEGFTGWYNQNFNGLNNPYTVVSTGYEENGQTLTGLNPYGKTDVRIEIDRVGGYNSNEKIQVQIFKVPVSSNQYTGTQSTYTDNFILKTQILEIDAVAFTNAPFSDVQATVGGGGELIVEFGFEYNALDKARILQGDSYIIAVTHQPQGETAGDSSRVMLLADVAQYGVGAFITGLTTFTKFRYLEHNEVLGTDVGELTKTSLYNEDGLLVDFDFELNKAQKAVLNSVQFLLVGEKDGEVFELSNFTTDTSGAVISSGIQQVNVNATRGYVLPNNDQFNAVRVKFDSVDGTDHIYKGNVAFKIRWEDWLPNDQVPSEFYNDGLPNDNLNFKSSNYSNVNDWNIRLIAIANTVGEDEFGNGGLGRDVFLGGVLRVRNYGVSDDGEFTNAIITLLDPDTLQDTGGVPLANKDTLFRVDWTNVNTIDIAKLDYVIHRVEQSGDGGQQIEELSSIRANIFAVLKPVAGSFLSVSDNAGNLRSECLIDFTRLNPNAQYNFSARVKSQKLTNGDYKEEDYKEEDYLKY